VPAGNKNRNVDRYEIQHNLIPNQSRPLISILCFFSGDPDPNIPVGVIEFYPKGQVPASKVHFNDRFDLNYEIDRYPEIIETLRYEKPINLYADWDAKNVIVAGYVGTNSEPIGEQEGV
jgi:hypothetical protein